ncbi:MAG: hypothetical protein M1838_004353 [Thelocarpon superellum]|nr:MAG: hypothetical protein M1838_004353 [Thelocarpon superellum]
MCHYTKTHHLCGHVRSKQVEYCWKRKTKAQRALKKRCTMTAKQERTAEDCSHCETVKWCRHQKHTSIWAHLYPGRMIPPLDEWPQDQRYLKHWAWNYYGSRPVPPDPGDYPMPPPNRASTQRLAQATARIETAISASTTPAM